MSLVGRAILVGVTTILVGAVVVRNAAVRQYAETKPLVAARVWPSHPSAELWTGLTQIGSAARDRKPVGPVTLALVRDAGVKAPLAPEPFLVRGVQAQLAGDQTLATEAFLAARLRDGRSIPARYFLAEQYLRSGDAAHGLRELAILARTVPDGVSNLAPYVAAYAKDPRSRGQLQSLFRSNPMLEQAALSTLATDAKNTDLILGLATPAAKPPSWSGGLLNALVAAGQYARARDVWARLSRVTLPPGQLVFDPGFAGSDAPPPFNWILASSTVGLAERQPGGRLHAMFYGQDDGVLASQLLILAPGRYRLSMRISGDVSHASTLSWTVTCVASKAVLATLRLSEAKHAADGVTFDVPANCGAQAFELSGNASDDATRVDVTVSDLKLQREGGND